MTTLMAGVWQVMMKKTLLLISLLALLLMGTKPSPIRLVRLTVVNKSGLKIEISLTGAHTETSYYLRMLEGDRQFPTEKVFTIIPDIYTSKLYYIELWDPVYGPSCSSKSHTVDATRNTRIMVLECDRTPPNAGEESMLKYGAVRSWRGR